MTAIHVVTLLEEMPVQETTDAIDELRGLGIPIGSVIVNATLPPMLAGARVNQAELRRGLTRAGLPTDRDTLAGLVAEAKAYQTRLGVEAALREDLAALGRPIVELPALIDGVTREGLDTLARALLDAS
jgi:anion-transporting  ArsA/GET3 family ATPase